MLPWNHALEIYVKYAVHTIANDNGVHLTSQLHVETNTPPIIRNEHLENTSNFTAWRNEKSMHGISAMQNLIYSFTMQIPTQLIDRYKKKYSYIGCVW